METQYLIFNMSEVSKINFSQILETSLDTLRKSIDESKSFIKWEGESPDFIQNLNYTEGPYNNSEMMTILSTTEWSSPYL